MIDNEFLKKMIDVRNEIEKKKGSCVLFGLFRRDEANILWDVVISAAWFYKSYKDTMDYIVNIIKEKLTEDEIVNISHISLLEPSDKFVNEVISLHSQPENYTNILIEENYSVGDIFIIQSFLIPSNAKISSKRKILSKRFYPEFL